MFTKYKRNLIICSLLNLPTNILFMGTLILDLKECRRTPQVYVYFPLKALSR